MAVLRKTCFHSFDIYRLLKPSHVKKDRGEKLTETLIIFKLSSCS